MLEFVGWGGNTKILRRYTGFNTRASFGDVIVGDTWAIGGDSGGPILNENNELVGIISGGIFWDKHRFIEDTEGNKISMTWPVRGSSVNLIRNFIKENISSINIE